MSNKELILINKNSEVLLNKSKNLLDITSKILDKKTGGVKYQFCLPTDSSLTREQLSAIHKNNPVLIISESYIMNLICLLKIAQCSICREKKVLFICSSDLTKFLLQEKLSNTSKNSFITKKELETVYGINDKNIINTILNLKAKDIKYDEIFVDEGQDLSLNTYKILKELTPSLSISADNAPQINNRKEATNEEKITELFPSLIKYELDEIYRSAYELYKFAIQFIPYNEKANNEILLDRLKKKNSGADKPFVYEIQTLKDEIESINDIDINPTDNIVIALPYEDGKNNYDLSVDKYHKELSKILYCSKYYEGIEIKKLYHVVITTFENVKYLNPDCLILPQFDLSRSIVENEKIFDAITSTKNQIHIFQKICDYSDELVEKISLE